MLTIWRPRKWTEKCLSDTGEAGVTEKVGSGSYSKPTSYTVHLRYLDSQDPLDPDTKHRRYPTGRPAPMGVGHTCPAAGRSRALRTWWVRVLVHNPWA